MFRFFRQHAQGVIDTLRKEGFDRWFCILFALALAAITYVFLRSGALQFGNDAEANIQYIQYIVNHWALPKPYSGWAFYHPPLYYVLGALIYRAAEWSGLAPLAAVRVMTMAWFVVFLLFGVRILMRCIALPPARYTAAALLLFWPQGLFIASRINNEVPCFALFAASFYYLLRWQEGLDFHFFKIALPLAAAAMLAKGNAITLFAIIGFVALYNLQRKDYPFSRLLRRDLLPLIVFTLLMANANTMRIVYYKLAEHRDDPILIANLSRTDPRLIIPADLKDFIYFDIGNFLTVPHYAIWNDSSKRQLFWNSFLKSALFGDKYFRSPIGFILCFLWLVVIGYGIFPLLYRSRERPEARTGFLMGSTVVLFILSSMLVRVYSGGSATTQEFRYVYPLLIPLVYFYARAMQFYAVRWRPAYYAGMVQAAVFCYLSVALFIVVL